MNCPSCQHENPDSARFCNECASPLSGSCPACGGENPPGAKFCNECAAPLTAARSSQIERDPLSYTPKHLADKILQSKSALEGERKQVTVLFADVKGSMELAEQVGPEVWHAILDRFFQILTDGVHRFEGTVNQYLGDGIMALFGAPIAHEDHAQRACYASLHLRDELRRYADELRRTKSLSLSSRIGLNSGEVVVGKIGDDLRMDYTAQGHTVGLAARMEELAEPGTVFLTEPTRRLVEGFFQLRDLGDFDVKGASGPLHVFELEGAGPLRTRLDASRARGFSRFVGRTDEMATLEAALHRSVEGQGQVVGVVGEAGVGKSRLCDEFVERCRAKGIRVLQAQCPSYGKAVPLLPILELLRDSFGITEQDSDQIAREKIAGRLLLLDEAFRETLPLVFDLLGVPDSNRPSPQIDPEARRRRLFAFVRRLVQARSEQEPAVLFFDDLHWIDAASDGFLAQLVEATSGTRTLVLANYRPEYAAAWTRKSYYQQLPISPLGPEEVAEMVTELLGHDDSVARLPALVQEKAGGNPFFTEEVVQSLVDSGALEGERGAYRLVRPFQDLGVPVTVQSLVAARIDRLPEREQQVLRAAAVIGGEFSEPLLSAVLELPDEDLASSLSRLQSGEFILEQAIYPVAEYAFKHPLTQAVALESQLQDRRARMHATVARTLEEQHAGRLNDQAALLAHHWEQAGEKALAARWHARAAEHGRSRDLGDQLGHWQRVRALLGEPTSGEALELAVVARVFVLGIGPMRGLADDEADRVLAEGRRLAERSANPRRPVQLLMHFARGRVLTGDASAGFRHYEEAVKQAREIADPGVEVGALTGLAWTQLSLGRLPDCLTSLRTAAQVLGGAPLPDALHDRLEAVLSELRVWALVESGQLRAAESEEVEQHGRQARLFLARGDAEQGLDHARIHLEFADSVGDENERVGGLTGLGVALLHQGRWQEAIERLEAAHALAVRHAVYLNLEATPLTALARACAGQGDSEKATETAERAIRVAQKRGSRQYEADAWIALAEALQQSDLPEADQRIEEALERAALLIEETGAGLFLPGVHEQRAALAHRRGDTAATERELREAHRLYTEMGASGHAERLARELGI